MDESYECDKCETSKSEYLINLQNLKNEHKNQLELNFSNYTSQLKYEKDTHQSISGKLREQYESILKKELQECNEISEEKCKTLVKKISDLESELNDERKRRTSAVQKLAEALEANQEEVNQNLDLQNNFRRLEDEYNSLHKDINQKDEEVQHAQSERSVCQEGKLVL